MVIVKDWDSRQYIKFKTERTQPSVDLINRLDAAPRSVLDIGCGPGNSTAQLYERFPLADIIGIDRSENMLQEARSAYPGLVFKRCEVPGQLDCLGQFDLIFSNACLHWIPDHSHLLPKLADQLCENGVLAVQMPLVQHAQFYKAMDELLLDSKWKRLNAIKNFHLLPPDQTYDVLTAASLSVAMWETTYYHVVPSYDAVIEWYKGSGLRPYLEQLEEMERGEFLSELKEILKREMPVRADKKVLLKMPRLFFIAKKR